MGLLANAMWAAWSAWVTLGGDPRPTWPPPPPPVEWRIAE